MRLILVSCLAVLLTLSDPAAATPDVDQALTRLRHWLWPSRSIPLPMPAPLPKAEPVALPPVITPPPAPEIVTPASPAAPAAIKPHKRKSKPRVRADEGPDLPYSCITVRWAAAMFSRDYLEEQGRARGITERQRRQAQACLAGKN